VATFQYRCRQDGDFDVQRPIGTPAGAVHCPSCGGDAVRVFTAPMLSLASRDRMAVIDRAEQSRDEPEVVTSLPPTGHRRPRVASVSANPALARLPKP